MDEKDLTPEQAEGIQKLQEMFKPVELHEDLKPYVQTIEGVGWQALRHPLVYQVPYSEAMNNHANQYYLHNLKRVEEARAAGNYESFIFHHERPYRLEAFLDVVHDLADKQYWGCLSSVWTDSENIHQNFDDWKEAWDSKRPGRIEHVMDPECRKVYDALPDIVTIYRGYQNDMGFLGLSWTLSEDKARWFARRFLKPSDPTQRALVAKTKVPKSIVLAYFGGRNEQEIIVDPDTFTNAVQVQELKRK